MKNIKWILLALAGLGLICGFVVVLISTVVALMKGDAYALSVQALNENSDMVSMLGSPIEPGYWVGGTIKIAGPDGTASLEHFVDGAFESAQVYVYASKEADEWHLDKLIVSVGEQKIRYTLIGGPD